MMLLSDNTEWTISRNLCVRIDQPPVDVESTVTRYLHDRYDKDWHVHSIRIGERIDRGIYAYYPVESQCGPRYPLTIGGSNHHVFQFLLDRKDASALSSSL